MRLDLTVLAQLTTYILTNEPAYGFMFNFKKVALGFEWGPGLNGFKTYQLRSLSTSKLNGKICTVASWLLINTQLVCVYKPDVEFNVRFLCSFSCAGVPHYEVLCKVDLREITTTWIAKFAGMLCLAYVLSDHIQLNISDDHSLQEMANNKMRYGPSVDWMIHYPLEESMTSCSGKGP